MRIGYHPEPYWWNHLIHGLDSLVDRLSHLLHSRD